MCEYNMIKSMIKKTLVIFIIIASSLSYNVNSATVDSFNPIQTTNAIYSDPISTTNAIYKEGIYRFDYKKDVRVEVTLLTDKKTKLLLIDNDLGIAFFGLLPYNQKFVLISVKPNITYCIIGEGEVALSFTKI